MDFIEGIATIIMIVFFVFSFAIFCGGSAIISLVKVHIVKKKLKNNEAVDEAIYAAKMFAIYIQTPVYILSSFIYGHIIGSSTVSAEYWELFGIILFSGVSYMIALIIDNMVYHNTQRLTRKNVSTIKEKIWAIIKSVSIITASLEVMFYINRVVSNNEVVNSMFGMLSFTIVPFIFFMLIIIFMPNITKHMLKPKPLEDSDLTERLNNFVKKLGFDNVTFYVLATKKRQHANAFVYSVLKKNIYLTEYLIDNLSEEEIEAIVAHEIGHISKHHLLIRKIVHVIATLPIWQAIIMLNKDNILGAFIAIAITFMLIFIIKYINRAQENQADDYVIKESGVEPMTFVNSLIRLNKLNNSVRKLNKVDEKLKSHLGIEKRIKRIMETTTEGVYVE
ncbi:M48 family metalloprotease [Wukongibacter baidiensis]|uniref:M48 family metalloprotease n=1 Tax=Wukongibacter baidiensis TaxID=1723361 RepID=UPI003D7FE872